MRVEKESLQKIMCEFDKLKHPLDGVDKYFFYNKAFLTMNRNLADLDNIVVKKYGANMDFLDPFLVWSYQRKTCMSISYYFTNVEFYIFATCLSQASLNFLLKTVNLDAEFDEEHKDLFRKFCAMSIKMKKSYPGVRKFMNITDVCIERKIGMLWGLCDLLWRTLRHQYTTAVMTLLILTEQMKQELHHG